MKKSIAMLLALVMAAAALTACRPKAGAVAEQPASVPVDEASGEELQPVENPMTHYVHLAEMLAAVPGIRMSDAPAGAGNISYDTITGAEISPIAQIMFTLGGDTYTYRAAACPSESAMGDIAGVYGSFRNKENLLGDSNLTGGGSYKLEYNAGDPMGLATWFYPPTNCQYSLFTETGCGEDQKIEEVVDELIDVPGTVNIVQENVKTPEQTQLVSGTVVAVGSNQIVINMKNGNTLTFLMSAIKTTAAVAGDTVDIVYSGSIVDAPEAVSITVTSAAPQVVAGDVVQYDANGLYIRTTTGNIYGFAVGAATRVTGKTAVVQPDDTVQITYAGALLNLPTAISVEVLKSAPKQEPKKVPLNKSLDGWVTEIKTKTFTILTNEGKYWTFHKDGGTAYYGGYTFQEWASVRVLYDGYASNHPVAKEITVLAPPDPTPPDPPAPPVYRTVEGWITVNAGNALSIITDSGREYSFLLAGPNISGDSDSANYAYITYYEAGGYQTVTDVTFELRLLQEPGPVIDPEPDPEPDPDPVIFGNAQERE